MKIFLDSSRDPTGQLYISLRRDNWDDFGLKTTFLLTVRNDAVRHFIGQVKIIDSKSRLGETKIDSGWSTLPQSFCSLGQSTEFYRRLRQLVPEHESVVLTALRDCAFDADIYQEFSDTPQFIDSLARFAPAQAALKFARRQYSSPLSQLHKQEDGQNSHNFTFSTKLKGFSKNHIINFEFPDSADSKIPSKINVIIGRNGTGKTQLLSDLARSVSGYGHTHDEFHESRKDKFPGLKPDFSNVIVVSYSAFDNFEIPGKNKGEQRVISKTGTMFGYTYCGLREHAKDGNYRIKRPEEIFEEFKASLQSIQDNCRQDAFLKCLSHVLKDPALLSVDETNILPKFHTLSSGQKIVLTMLTNLLNHVKASSLIIIDEPETHLHPSLTSAFMHSLRSILETFDSYAVVATHSPVVLQETPSKFVRILTGTPTSPFVKSPGKETFGEELSTLTEDVFGLPFEQSNFYIVLKQLSDQGMSKAAIEGLFGNPLGMTARSFID